MRTWKAEGCVFVLSYKYFPCDKFFKSLVPGLKYRDFLLWMSHDF